MKHRTIFTAALLIFLFSSAVFSQWIPQSSGVSQRLTSVFFTDANKGWAAGYAGTIRYTTNGGANWTTQNSNSAVIFIRYFLQIPVWDG
jgi:hypothetical protein